MTFKHGTIAGAIVALMAGGAVGADEPILVTDLGGADIVIEIGARGYAKNRFQGSDETLVAVSPLIKLNYLEIPGLLTIGGGPASAFSLRPAFNVLGEREGDDIALGLRDVDAAYEVGFGASYRVGALRALGEVRRGFGGHEGVVGEVGADVVLEPNAEFSLSFGPRATFASDGYADTYFTVSEAEAAATGLAPFQAEGGLTGLGLAAEARYELNEDWTAYADAGWIRLTEDADASPLVEEDDQFEVGLGLTYRFRFDVFD